MLKQLPHEWLWPHRPKPSSNFSFADIKKTALQLKVRCCQALLFESRRMKIYLHSSDQHLNPKCSPNDYLFPEIARLETSCSGLSLETWLLSKDFSYVLGLLLVYSLVICQPVLYTRYTCKTHDVFFSFLYWHNGQYTWVGLEWYDAAPENDTNPLDTFCATQRVVYPLNLFPSIAIHRCKKSPPTI